MPDATIALFDRVAAGGHTRWRPGETLSPGAAPILHSLGCWEAFVESGFLESFGTRAAWGAAEAHENDFVFSLAGHGWRLDRARFDNMLLERAKRCGAMCFPGTTLLESFEDGAAVWRLRFRGIECSARFVIDASGRTAAFAVQRGARRMPDDRLAGVVVLHDSDAGGDTLIEAAENGWWYSTSVPGSKVVAAFMTDIDQVREQELSDAGRWQSCLAKSTYTRERLSGARANGRPAVFTAHSQRLSRTGGRGWVAAGDAAMAFDPLSSQGILKALRSGKLASFVAADLLVHGRNSARKYEVIATAEYDEYRKAKLLFYSIEQRWPESPFWKRRR
jgi:flavin-dependent dehydrogenase